MSAIQRDQAPTRLSRHVLRGGQQRIIPSGRALLGATLCSLSALTVLYSFRQAAKPPTTVFATAGRNLAPGEVLTATDIVYVPIELPVTLAAHAVGRETVLEGVAVLSPLSKGELFQRGSLLKRQSSDPLISFPVSSSYAVSGRITPGSTVSVYASDATETRLIASGLRVIRVDGGERQSSQGTVVLTVSLPQTLNRIALVHASINAKLSIVDESVKPAVGPTTEAAVTVSTQASPNFTNGSANVPAR